MNEKSLRAAKIVFSNMKWSYTSYSTLKRCPFAFQKIYLEGYPHRAEESEAAKVGLIVHDTMEEKISSEELPKHEDIINILQKKAQTSGVEFQKVAPHATNIHRIAKSVHESRHKYKAIFVEKELTDGNFRGRIDLILVSEKSKLIFVVDHKTTESSWTDLKYYKDQLYLYGWLSLVNLPDLLQDNLVNPQEYVVIHGINFSRHDVTVWDSYKRNYEFLRQHRKNLEENAVNFLSVQIEKHGLAGTWDVTPNALCHHCDIRHICPYYKEKYPDIVEKINLERNSNKRENVLEGLLSLISKSENK